MPNKINNKFIKKIILVIGLVFGLFLLIHNSYYYDYFGGYNATVHMNYAKIISHEFRFPSFKESYENYNPPLFYLVSGLIGRFTSQISGLDFYSSLNAYKVIGVLLAIGSIYFWHKIIQSLYPKRINLRTIFLILLFSLPVFHKVAVMFNTELPLMFVYSLTLWFFITHFFNKPSKKSIVLLALFITIALLIRMSSLTLFVSIFIGILGMGLLKKISWKKTLTYLSIFLTIIFISTSWFYIGRRDKDIYKAGRVSEPDIPIWQRQPIEFYTYIPFKFMMTYPMRLSMPLNHIIPIYYSEFWGDFWNYYSQRRFGVSAETRRSNHYITTPQRVANLALQNQVNLPFTIIMLAGFIYINLRVIKGLFSRSKPKIWLIEVVFLCVSFLTWIGFLIMNVKYPNWKSDAVKASYMLNIIPIFVYSGVIFIFNVLKKFKFVFYPVLIWLSLSTVINLWWAYY